MSVTAINSLTAPITHFPGGTVAIRCADFVFPSTRATVSVVSDADSVSGDVVNETQLVPYSTSAGFGPPYDPDYEFVDIELADPTLLIPIADLDLEDEVSYVAFVGVQIIGAGDINHRVNDDFMSISDQNARIMGFNDVIDQSAYSAFSPRMPRPETNPTYRLKWFQYIDWEDIAPVTIPYHGFAANLLLDPPPTDLIVVAASGEDSTYEFNLDAIYLVPWRSGANPGANYFQEPADLTAWDPMYDPWIGDPEPTQAHDDDDATNALNILTSDDAGYSVIYAEPPGFGSEYLAPGGDYQRARTEPTAYNIMGFGEWSGAPPTFPDDPRSWIAVTTAIVVIPSQTVETESFSTPIGPDTSPWTFLSDSGEYYWEMFATGIGSVAGGVLDFDNVECLTNDARHIAQLGVVGAPLPVVGSPSHTEIRQSLHDLSSGIIEVNATIESVTDNGEMYAWVGWESHSGNDNDMNIVGVALYMDGADLKATLRSHAVYDPQFGTTRYNRANFGTSPVTVDAGYTLGDVISVKVERRYYVWRAKVWVGGAEPGSWTLEGYQPHFWPDAFTSPTVLNVSQHPYTNANNDEWGSGVRVESNQFPSLGVVTDPLTGSPSVFGHVTFDDFVLTYDPVGTRDTGHIALEKYDGSVDYGTDSFDGDRVVIVSLAYHTFEDDSLGYNVFLWADSGAAELQSVTSSDFIMRAPLGRVYLYGDITFP